MDNQDSKGPTSGDVHLFRDPKTDDSHFPMYYADCEGFGDGVSHPQGSQVMGEATNTHVGHRSKMSKFLKSAVKHEPKVHQVTSFNKTEGNMREWMVQKLFPRILFPFSDTVVMVTRNLR